MLQSSCCDIFLLISDIWVWSINERDIIETMAILYLIILVFCIMSAHQINQARLIVQKGFIRQPSLVQGQLPSHFY